VGEIGEKDLKSKSEPEIISELVEMMFGRRSGDPEATRRDVQDLSSVKPILEVRDLHLSAASGHHGLKSINFDVRPGEILGIAGIDGNGQKQLAEALAGQRASTGSIRLDGVELSAKSQGERRQLGLRYLTDDRLGEGTVGMFPVATNFFLKEIGRAPLWKKGIEQRGTIAAEASELVKRYDVRTPGVHTPVGRLSGGNIQKLIIAREMAEGARAVIFNKPTYGLDLANTLATRGRIREVAAKGMAVLLISTDLEELLALADRIAVMSGGAITGIVDNGEAAHSAIGRLMIGLAA
jgi:simple sugar transport system ATP-binding protein